MKTEITGFEQAKEIVEELKNCGADNMVLTYDNWTNAGIAGKVDYKAKPAGYWAVKVRLRNLPIIL